MQTQGTKLIVPRFTGNQQPIEIDMDLPYRAEARISEIAFANKQTAPELAAYFNTAYGFLASAYAKLHYEMGMSEVALKKRKAYLTLDVIPDKAKEKGFGKSNEDIREAFCYADADYVAIKESLAAIEATKELVYIKMNALRMALETTKNILKEPTIMGTNPNLSVGPLPEDLPRNAVVQGRDYTPSVTVPGVVVPQTTVFPTALPGVAVEAKLPTSVVNQEPSYQGWGMKAR